jgi:threonine dehydratase
VTPVGGGGLAAGILLRLRDLGRTDIIVHGAEAEGSNSATRSLARHERTRAERPNMRYGGSAVQTIGKLAFETFQNSSQFHLVKVPDYDVDELSDLYLQGQYDLLRTNTSNFEPTSLVAVAALKQLRDLRGTVTVLGTGQNDSVYPKYSTNSRRLFL